MSKSELVWRYPQLSWEKRSSGKYAEGTPGIRIHRRVMALCPLLAACTSGHFVCSKCQIHLCTSIPFILSVCIRDSSEVPQPELLPGWSGCGLGRVFLIVKDGVVEKDEESLGCCLFSCQASQGWLVSVWCIFVFVQFVCRWKSIFPLFSLFKLISICRSVLAWYYWSIHQ